MYGKKLISVRVDADDYAIIMEHLKKKNAGKVWQKDTFADIVANAMRDYMIKNKLL